MKSLALVMASGLFLHGDLTAGPVGCWIGQVLGQPGLHRFRHRPQTTFLVVEMEPQAFDRAADLVTNPHDVADVHLPGIKAQDQTIKG